MPRSILYIRSFEDFEWVGWIVDFEFAVRARLRALIALVIDSASSFAFIVPSPSPLLTMVPALLLLHHR